MPDFEFTHPDGRVFQLTAPDATTAAAKFKQAFPDAIPSDPTAPTDPDIQLQPGERVLTVGGKDRSGTGQQEGVRPNVDAATAIGRGMAQGATFNFEPRMAGAEAASGLPEPPDVWPLSTGYNNAVRLPIGAARMAAEKLAPSVFGQKGTEAYNQKFEEERQANEEAAQQRPWSYLGGNLAGGVATALVAPELAPFKVAQGAPLTLRALGGLGDMATGGAAYGAVAGAGEASDVASMPGEAAIGGGVGAVVGPALGTILTGIGKTGKAIYKHAFVNPADVADEAIRRKATADMRGLARTGNPEDLPQSLPEVQARMQEAQNPPPGVEPQNLTMADVVGPQMQKQVGTIVRGGDEAGTAAETFLHNRQTGAKPLKGENLNEAQAGRISSAVTTLLGDGKTAAKAKQLMDVRRNNAKPLYDAAHIRPMDYNKQSGKDLLSILENSIPNEAKKSANRILAADNQAGHQAIWVKSGKKFVLKAVPNTRHWDYIQQGLQHVIDSGTDKITGDVSTEARAFIGLRERINALLADNNPAIAAAQKQYAGDSKMLEALRAGAKHWTKSDAEARETLFNLATPGEKEMYRLAAADAMRTQVLSGVHGANKVDTVLGSPDKVIKTRLIAPDKKSYDTFSRYLDNEKRMFMTRQRATAGSPTAERLADDQEAARKVAEVATMGLQAIKGHTIGLARSVYRHLSKINPENRAAVMEATRRVVLNPDPTAIAALMDRIEKGTGSRVAARAFADTITRSLPRALDTAMMGRRNPPQRAQ